MLRRLILGGKATEKGLPSKSNRNKNILTSSHLAAIENGGRIPWRLGTMALA
jgi:hypothetical protein